ncbi:SAM-dependent methyltransferase [Streptomyces griseoviridis]|uniref:S-adenosyl-L-methionine-dependent methyltransferase n=1 Tax=Streptomyces griseoviridis TaxID=45398 RepID=A0A3S9ZP94_STRGD|nr:MULTISPECIES: SAM-dependent methyltransferase [Streptomyces]AZS89383.1 SAM-dependent methyltransferase [Streptomyces griseoviridis]MDH6699352.1 methyltransferase (TIGR00027 family) [Streptomyces sp. MAA16]QCN83772.1 SAM-dependent methyltransferase [Streptomyces griseoviridis]
MTTTTSARPGDRGGEPEPRPAPGVVAGVGRTALMVAAARAIESGRPDALAQDPYAAHFVRAAAAGGEWPLHPDEVPGGEADPLWGRLGRYFGLRTRVFDDHLLRQAEAGVRQFVLLGAGLDARAHRLPWPRDCTVYELDRASVLAFKQRALDALDPAAATPRARRVPIAADLRLDWIDSLSATGFDPDLPTAWMAEGLLLYLPSTVENRLVDIIDAYSASGSTLAYEVKLSIETEAVRTSPIYEAASERIGIDMIALFDPDPRPDSVADLAERGWHTETHIPFDHSRRLGRGPLPLPTDALNANRWTFAALGDEKLLPGQGVRR